MCVLFLLEEIVLMEGERKKERKKEEAVPVVKFGVEANWERRGKEDGGWSGLKIESEKD